MSDEEALKLLGETNVIKKSTVLQLHGPQAALLWLLYKLGVIGMRRVSYSYAQMLMQNKPLTPPPCSVACSIVSVNRDYLQFCPKHMADEDLKEYKPK